MNKQTIYQLVASGETTGGYREQLESCFYTTEEEALSKKDSFIQHCLDAMNYPYFQTLEDIESCKVRTHTLILPEIANATSRD